MKFWEVIKVALGSLRANKMRSSLTVLGIVIGIFSIISISTIISMLQGSVEEGLSMLGKNTFQIMKFPAMQMGRQSEKIRNRRDIVIEDYYRLREMLTVAKYVGGEQWGFNKIVKSRWDKTNPNVQMAGVTPEALPNNNWVLEEGRAINFSDLDRYQSVCILGADVAKRLFKFINPVGQEIKIDGLRLKVIGVFEAQGQIFGQSQDNFVTIPLTTFQNKYGKRNRTVHITIMAHNSDVYEDTIESAIGHMRTIRKVPPGEENDFSIFSNESLIMQMNDITKYVKVGAIVVALIALLAAGIGIMNIMLVSVTERTREIGIRKAIGAKRKNILFQFLIEAITLSQIGGIVGIILGVGVGNLAGSFLNASPTIPMDWLLIGVTLCFVVGVVFGTYPAYKASNLDPIEALRYE